MTTPTTTSQTLFSKVPAIALSFWIIKILCTTVGETGADFLAVNAGLGAPLTMALMGGLMVIALALQLRTARYTPWAYWLTVVLVSIVGTQITDFFTDILGVSLMLSTPIFAVVLAAVFYLWYRVEKNLSIHEIYTTRSELFYWAAILCTFALGTAAGDLTSEASGFGFGWGTVIFASLIAATYTAWRMGANAVLTFWIGYILTRPFGAALGDLLTQTQQAGGLGMGTAWTSALFLTVILLLVGFAQWTLEPAAAPQH